MVVLVEVHFLAALSQFPDCRKFAKKWLIVFVCVLFCEKFIGYPVSPAG